MSGCVDVCVGGSCLVPLRSVLLYVSVSLYVFMPRVNACVQERACAAMFIQINKVYCHARAQAQTRKCKTINMNMHTTVNKFLRKY